MRNNGPSFPSNFQQARSIKEVIIEALEVGEAAKNLEMENISKQLLNNNIFVVNKNSFHFSDYVCFFNRMTQWLTYS
jgi:hypothetical protein